MSLYYIESTILNPYHNIALEEQLTHAVQASDIILYIWRNKRTVVVGKNQNILNECRCSLLKEDGGFPARRLSGGGAVYHDEGNVNFSFIAQKPLYDVIGQTSVILHAVRRMGIEAVRSGRNDLTVDGKKFSGNAFFSWKNSNCHHGTLLLKTDTEQLQKYLTVSEKKLAGNAVNSVRSRVANLSEYNSSITVDSTAAALRSSFADVYGGTVKEFPSEWIDNSKLKDGEKRFSSDEWIYGSPCHYSFTIEHKFPWGLVEICIDVKGGKISSCVVHTDALETDLFPRTAKALRGTRFSRPDIAAVFSNQELSPEVTEQNRIVLQNMREILSIELEQQGL